jgi:hypothetical protein
MAGEFPGSPRLLKGALVSYSNPVLGVIPNVILFQYNPEQLTRSLQMRLSYEPPSGAGQAVDDILKVSGPPTESINLAIEIDATDQLERSNPLAVLRGIQPTLAALELLLYPKNREVLSNKARAEFDGTYVPEDLPLVLFVWGAARVLPVRLSSFTITEQAFDAMLNPILARVDLGLEVLSYKETGQDSIAHGVYLAMMVQREVLAGLNVLNNAEAVLGLLPI